MKKSKKFENKVLKEVVDMKYIKTGWICVVLYIDKKEVNAIYINGKKVIDKIKIDKLKHILSDDIKKETK